LQHAFGCLSLSLSLTPLCHAVCAAAVQSLCNVVNSGALGIVLKEAHLLLREVGGDVMRGLYDAFRRKEERERVWREGLHQKAITLVDFFELSLFFQLL
jgi:hypothetical protein